MKESMMKKRLVKSTHNSRKGWEVKYPKSGETLLSNLKPDEPYFIIPASNPNAVRLLEELEETYWVNLNYPETAHNISSNIQDMKNWRLQNGLGI